MTPTNSLPLARRLAGFTLIEVTLVIAVLLSIISVLFFGIGAYREGSDRAHCIQQVVAVQKAMRSHCNLSYLNPGDSSAGLRDAIIGAGKFIEYAPVCPANGSYSDSGNLVPAAGVLYFTCSLSGHAPSAVTPW